MSQIYLSADLGLLDPSITVRQWLGIICYVQFESTSLDSTFRSVVTINTADLFSADLGFTYASNKSKTMIKKDLLCKQKVEVGVQIPGQCL